MSEPLSLAVALIGGIVLGVFFFSGLWWTISKGLSSKQSVLWFFGSMLIRMSIVVLGFYLMLGDDWKRLLAGLFGFIVARTVVMRLIRGTEQSRKMAQEAGHAS
ncbi:MAG TPA: ATP synthase subunit I [Gallionella sp.]|jgi:F1F0 ATPase subunit 2|nr:ATP synthase subunit I [Gallionella sp.]